MRIKRIIRRAHFAFFAMSPPRLATIIVGRRDRTKCDKGAGACSLPAPASGGEHADDVDLQAWPAISRHITASRFGRAAFLELARWLASALRRGVIRVLGIRFNFLLT